MPSEKAYWVILIVVFSGFASSIWFLLVPYGFVEYNLGVNLFTSSIFMVLTIFFLSYLSNLRQQNEWKSVKRGVDETISWHMKNIASELTYLLDFPSELLDFSTGGQWGVEYKKSLVAQMKYLVGKDAKEIDLSHVGKNYLSSEGLQILRDSCLKELNSISNVESKYGKFLKPSLTVLLMQLQNDLRGIIDLISMKDDFEDYLSLIVFPIHAAIREICKMHETEIELHPLQTK